MLPAVGFSALAADVNGDVVGVPMETPTFVALRGFGQKMGRIEAEFPEDFHRDTPPAPPLRGIRANP